DDDRRGRAARVVGVHEATRAAAAHAGAEADAKHVVAQQREAREARLAEAQSRDDRLGARAVLPRAHDQLEAALVAGALRAAYVARLPAGSDAGLAVRGAARWQHLGPATVGLAAAGEGERSCGTARARHGEGDAARRLLQPGLRHRHV